jgi:hypothetical protein
VGCEIILALKLHKRSSPFGFGLGQNCSHPWEAWESMKVVELEVREEFAAGEELFWFFPPNLLIS